MKSGLRIAAAEFLGALLLAVAVVGSGIMAERLAGGNQGLALLANSIATGGALYVLITVFGPISGAHFNPLVTLWANWQSPSAAAHLTRVIAAQCIGTCAGVVLTHAMFGLPLLQLSSTQRAGPGLWLGEVVATAGLILVIALGAKRQAYPIAAVVAAYITAAYWFTSSTSFANPAITLARALSNTFAGIAPDSVLGFILAQCVGALVGALLARYFDSDDSSAAG